MNVIIIITALALLSASGVKAQIDNARTDRVKVNGDCGMCEVTIEKAGNKKKHYKTDWDADTKIAIITYNSKKTDLDAILKSIALSGYDNQNYLAPDEAYAKLPGCCQYKREKKALVKTTIAPNKDPMPVMQDHTGHNQGTEAKEMKDASQLKAVFENYFELKNALVKTDGTTASAKAEALLTSLKTVEMGKLKMVEHDVWMKVEKNLMTDAQHIKENKDTEHQREYFMSLSKNIYELVKVAKLTEIVYYQFCPMANDGKGANWLSKESAIKNPYYGSQMLSCGKVVETIKQ